ncbi:MAG TPA: sialidase family protein [Terriglobales bacterium]|nr:sialidase family protein [Terriglobales bacterium]
MIDMVRIRNVAPAAICLAILVGCNRHSTTKISFETQPRQVLAKSGAMETRDPSLSVSSSGMLGMLTVYADTAGNHVGYAMSHDGGDSFMPIAPVSDPTAKINSHGESAPSLATTPQAIYALWQQRSDKGNQLAVARSLNFGKSFDKPVIVTGDESPAFHGFASLGVSPNGDVYAAWLDGRESAPGSGSFAVYVSRSTDRGASFETPRRVALSACPCCRPAIAFGPNNEVIIAWRKVFDSDIRDMVVSVSHDGGQTFSSETRVADDGWQLVACPDSGPSMAMKGSRLYIAWLTEGRERKSRIQISWSDDLGKTFHAPMLASGDVLDPNHPRLRISEDGNILLSFQGRPANTANGWDPAQIFVTQVGGDLSSPLAITNTKESAAYPALGMGTAGRVYIAWTSSNDQSSKVNLLRARIE